MKLNAGILILRIDLNKVFVMQKLKFAHIRFLYTKMQKI